MALYAFDGTWDDASAHTNVLAFFSAYNRNRPSKHNMYFEGVGTKTTLLGKLIGGLWGAGEDDKVDQAVACLEDAIKDGDSIIDIIGFSRGAATALDFANRAYKCGHRIRFLGLWDTVAAFGLANIGYFFSKLTLGHKLTLPPHGVDLCFHAMALDEHRPGFVVTRVSGAYEVWFRGCHTDIGGGAQAPGLSNIALRWMLIKAMMSDLPITGADINSVVGDPEAPIGPTWLSKHSDFTRKFYSTDLVHYTVYPRQGCVNPTQPFAWETTTSERWGEKKQAA